MSATSKRSPSRARTGQTAPSSGMCPSPMGLARWEMSARRRRPAARSEWQPLGLPHGWHCVCWRMNISEWRCSGEASGIARSKTQRWPCASSCARTNCCSNTYCSKVDTLGGAQSSFRVCRTSRIVSHSSDKHANLSVHAWSEDLHVYLGIQVRLSRIGDDRTDIGLELWRWSCELDGHGVTLTG